MFTLPRHLILATPKRHPLRRLFAALALHRQRQHLLALDDHMLRDIGLTAAMARTEAARPLWDAPHGWVQQRP